MNNNNNNNNNASRMILIRASAGTGKTHRLASEFRHLLVNEDAGANPTQIIATTFTNQAASELVQRVRKILLRNAHWEKAQSLFAAYTGTVNSVCGRLIADLAVESGLAPSLRIIPELQQRAVLDSAVEEVLNFYASKIWRVVYRMGKESDWRDDVVRIMNIARQNDIGPEQLADFATSSWSSYSRFFPDACGRRDDLESKLIIEMNRIMASSEDTGWSKKSVEQLAEIRRTWDSTGDLPWKAFVKISKLTTKNGGELKQQASLHLYLEEFQHDIKTLIHEMFRCAGDCLRVYEKFKTERGLLDFIDQETLTLTLIQDPTAKSKLNQRFTALLVDEFQDTSPLQLALFVGLAEVVQDSVWVGDEKQSIYGFRGANPKLMQKTIDKLVLANGGSIDHLSRSYRSRPALLQLTNSVFIPSMDVIGINGSTVEIVHSAREDDKRFNHPIHFWWLDVPKSKSATKALCISIKEILQNTSDWPTETDERLRPLQGADIAVLCRTNARRLEVSNELAKLGIAASTERDGLLKTTECSLVLACLRFLADEYDTLAMAEIVKLTDQNEDSQQWLSDWLDKGGDNVRTSNSALCALDQFREKLFGLTPSESLQLTAANPVVIDTILKWGNARQRLLNLDALIGLADAYEDYCSTSRHAATVPGLLTFLHSKYINAFQPASTDENAVQVTTYHKAKGLEWPLVILYDLDEPPDATPFGVNLTSTAEECDPYAPLKGQAIRYWPWPYGKERTQIQLRTAALDTPEMAAAELQRSEENLRLLYVGMTRARDYLIFAASKSKNGAGWLNMVNEVNGKEIFDLTHKAGMVNLLFPPEEAIAQSSIVSAADDEEITSIKYSMDRFCFENAITNVPEVAYSCAPSALSCSNGSLQQSSMKKTIYLGGRMMMATTQDLRTLGDVLHFFLATDNPQSPLSDRLQHALELINSYSIQCSANEFIECSLRLRAKLDELYHGAKWLRECPITGRVNGQRMTGAIDLLLELSEGFVVIDHKTFPGKREMWEEMSTKYFPQVEAYCVMVQEASLKPVIAAYVHLPINGTLVELDLRNVVLEQEHHDGNKWVVL